MMWCITCDKKHGCPAWLYASSEPSRAKPLDSCEHKEEALGIKQSPHGQAPLSEGDLPSKEGSKKVNLQGEVGGLEKGD